MPRQIGTDFEPTPLYRAVLLKNFPGVHDLPPFDYHSEGNDPILYHLYECYGIYESEGTAQAQLKRVLRSHQNRIRQGAYAYPHWGPGTVPKVTTVVEEVVPQWSPIARTLTVHD